MIAHGTTALALIAHGTTARALTIADCLGPTTVRGPPHGTVALALMISSGRVFTRNTRVQWKSLHSWIILVIVKQHLVQIGRIDGPTEYFW